MMQVNYGLSWADVRPLFSILENVALTAPDSEHIR